MPSLVILNGAEYVCRPPPSRLYSVEARPQLEWSVPVRVTVGSLSFQPLGFGAGETDAAVGDGVC